MLEVVIALTVIAIVSASAFALIHSHIKLEKQSVQSIEATNIAENAIECFRFAKDGDDEDIDLINEFIAVYTAATEKVPKNNDDGTYGYVDGALTVTFTFTGTDTITVKVEYGDQELNQTYTKYVNK